MARALVQSFIRGEVTIGIVLTLALLAGRSDPQTIAVTLGGLGVIFLLQAALPALRSPRRVGPSPADIRDPRGRPIPAAWTNCAQQASGSGSAVQADSIARRRNLTLVRGVASSGVILLTALLIYHVAPLAA